MGEISVLCKNIPEYTIVVSYHTVTHFYIAYKYIHIYVYIYMNENRTLYVFIHVFRTIKFSICDFVKFLHS